MIAEWIGYALIFATGAGIGAMIEAWVSRWETDQVLDEVEVKFAFTAKEGEEPQLIVKDAGESWDEFKERIVEELDEPPKQS